MTNDSRYFKNATSYMNASEENEICGGSNIPDPKYLGIPNIQFSLTEKNDDREEKFSKQRIERGFDDSETWNLCVTVAQFTIPRLERFIEIDAGYPEDMDTKKWQKKLGIMLEAFKLIVRDDSIWDFSEEENKTVNKGLKLFKKHFFDLWW